MTSTAYAWQLTRDLDAFLARAGDFLRAGPVRHTVPLTVTDALRRRGMDGYGDEPPLFGVLERDGAVRGTFFRTPPYRLNLTAVDERDADALAALLADVDTALTGAMAEPDTAGAFAEAWRRRTGATAVRVRSERLYRLVDLTAPGPVPAGRARVASGADRELLARWYRDFADAIGGSAQRDGGAWADDRISHGGVSLWEAPDGTPLAMAGATPPVAGQVRVGPVYTPGLPARPWLCGCRHRRGEPRRAGGRGPGGPALRRPRRSDEHRPLPAHRLPPRRGLRRLRLHGRPGRGQRGGRLTRRAVERGADLGRPRHGHSSSVVQPWAVRWYVRRTWRRRGSPWKNSTSVGRRR